MALFYNGAHVSPSNNVFINSQAARRVIYNGVEVWKKALQVYPGYGVANAQNQGSHKPYWSYSNNGNTVTVSSYGGTDAGYGFIAIGPFSSIGYSQCYFHNLSVNVEVNNGVKAEIGIGDINCGFHQKFLEPNANGSWGSGSVFNINAPNGGYYLLIRTWASADYSGHRITVNLTGFTLI